MFPRTHFYFAPDEPPAAPVETPVAAPAAPSAPATPVATPPAAAPAAVAATATPAAQSGTPAPAAQPSWLDGLRKAGWTGTETDETKVYQQLVQSHRDAEQLRPLAPHVTQYMQRAADFQKYLASQQQTPAPKPQADWTAELGWNPPPWDPQWRHLVTKDDKGNLIPVPGAPHDIVQKYQTAQQFREETVEKLLSNPAKFMEPYIKHVATQIAQEHAQQGVGQYREQVQAEQFLNQNSPWIYESDGNGGILQQQIFNPQTGKHEASKKLSKWGEMLRDRVNEYQRMGLGSEHQKELALRDVRFAYSQTPEGIAELTKSGQPAPVAPATPAAPAATPVPPQTPREAANAAFLQKSNPAGKRPGGNANPAPTPVNKNNFEQVLLQRVRDAGVTVN